MSQSCSISPGFVQGYGIDWDGPPVVDVDEGVTVPSTTAPLSNEYMDTLRSMVDPLSECEDHGVTFYVAVREFVRAIL